MSAPQLILLGTTIIVVVAGLYALIDDTKPKQTGTTSDTEDFRFRSIAHHLKEIRGLVDQKDKRIDGLHKRVDQLEQELSIERARGTTALETARRAGNRILDFEIERDKPKKNKKK